MTKDPIIKAIRQTRREIELACQNDPQAIYEYLSQAQEKYQNRLTRRSPKPALELADLKEQKS